MRMASSSGFPGTSSVRAPHPGTSRTGNLSSLPQRSCRSSNDAPAERLRPRLDGPHAMTQDPMDKVRAVARRVSNWGCWGKEDERGTLNLITPNVVRQAAACVRTGRVFSLGLALGPEGPQSGTVVGRFNPQHYMTAIGAPFGAPGGFHYSDDVICMPLQCA